MAKSLCVSIQQDKRKNRFQLRFRCCDSQLNIYKGIAAHTRHVGDLYDGGADSIRKATMLGLERLCTSLPAPTTPNRAVLDEALLRNVGSKVECYAADGAADEQLAG